MIYYFTYGSSDSHPYNGGWTCVEAHSLHEAIFIFRAVHKDTEEGFINCAGVYSEDEFEETEMFTKGNLGHTMWEYLKIDRLVVDEA